MKKSTNEILKENGMSLSFNVVKRNDKDYLILSIHKKGGKNKLVVMGKNINPKGIRTSIVRNRRISKELVYIHLHKSGMKPKMVYLGYNGNV